jgi:hypothetical protein
MNAPNPHSQVRHTLADPLAIPPSPTVQAAHAWKAATRPTPARPTLADAAVLALCVALLGVFVWTLHTPESEPTQITARAVAR